MTSITDYRVTSIRGLTEYLSEIIVFYLFILAFLPVKINYFGICVKLEKKN